MKYTIAILMILWGFVSCNPEMFNSIYVKNKAQLQQLPIDSMKFDAKNKWLYAISNDTKNLYVRFRITDEKQQRQLLGLGLTIWLDTLNKKNKIFGLKYPYRDIQNDFKPEMPPMMKPQKQQPDFAAFTDMIIYGLDGKDSENMAGTNNMLGITAQIQADENNIMYYTAIIPLKYVGKKPFSLAYQIVLPESGSRPQMDERPMSGSSGRGGGMHPGGMGGQSGMRPDEHPQQMQSTPVWIKNIVLQIPNL